MSEEKINQEEKKEEPKELQKEAQEKENNEELDTIQKDALSYQNVNRVLTENGFLFAVVSKHYEDGPKTTLLCNQNLKITTPLKFVIQESLIDSLNTLALNIAEDFHREGLTIGKASEFINPEKLANIIGTHLSKLESEGKIIINRGEKKTEKKESEN